jgi:2-dehydropantoate 2-reductase
VTNPKIAVLGSGANGSSIAADLAIGGADVVLIEQWPEHVRAIRSGGLRVEMPDSTDVVPIPAFDLCDVATFRDRFDIVLIGLKAYDTRWSCQLIEPYLNDDALVTGVQNGMSMGAVADVVGEGRSIGTVIEVTSMLLAPGVVRRQTPAARSWFGVGGVPGISDHRRDEVADVLRLAGKVETFDDIHAAKWMKLVSNCIIMVTTAILGGPVLASLELPGMRDLMLTSGQEALDLGVALGIPVLPIFGLSESDLRVHDRVVGTLLNTLAGEFTLPTTTTTVLYDWRHGRKSEAEDVNGHVVAECRKLGKGAPANEAIIEVARAIEAGQLSPGPENCRLLLEKFAAHGGWLASRI